MPLSADDKIEIQELVARYNRAVDSGDAQGWADTFTDDGVFESMRVGTHRGRQELVRFAEDFWTGDECAPWRGGQHWATNFIIEGDGDTASLFCYHIMFMPASPDEVNGVVMAAHDDVVARVDGRWKFLRRRVMPWPPEHVRSAQ